MFVTFATFSALVYGSETITVKSGILMFRIFVGLTRMSTLNGNARSNCFSCPCFENKKTPEPFSHPQN